MNTVKIATQIGEIDLSLNNEQMESLIEKGITLIKNNIKEQHPDWYVPETVGSGESIPYVDLEQYFPKHSQEELERIFKEAMSYEKNLRISLSTAAIVICVGIMSAFGGSNLSNLTSVGLKVISILGPFINSKTI